MSRKYQQCNTSLCFEDLSFMKEGEPSRTVDKSCITDPTPHNRLPIAARQHAHLHKECHGPVLRFCSSGVWSVHQCTAVVAKGKQSFLKVCPKDLFIYLFIWISSTRSVISVSAREQSFRMCSTAQLQADPWFVRSKVKGGKKYRQCSVLTVKTLKKQLAFSAWAHMQSWVRQYKTIL